MRGEERGPLSPCRRWQSDRMTASGAERPRKHWPLLHPVWVTAWFIYNPTHVSPRRENALQLKNSVTNIYSKISKQCEATHLRFKMVLALVKPLKRKLISCTLPVKHVCQDETHLCVTLLSGAWVRAQEMLPQCFWLHLQRAASLFYLKCYITF